MKYLVIFMLLIFVLIASIQAQTISTDSMKIEENGKIEYLYKYTFCLLNSGPQRNQDSSTVAEIQKGHLAHLNQLSDAGVLVSAGPFDWTGEGPQNWKGILIFKTDLNTAQDCGLKDPAVKAGRLVLECKAWWTGQKW